MFDQIRDWLIGLLQPKEVIEPSFQVGSKKFVTRSEILTAISAPIHPSEIKTRKQGTATIRYITARTVMNRLDEVALGLWEFRVTPVQVPTGNSGPDGKKQGGQYVMRGSLTICGITREDLGMNDNMENFDPAKAAASDALKRCAVQFGFGRELYGEEAPRPAKHWTETKVNVEKFWAWCEREEITEDEVYEQLGDTLLDWPNSKATMGILETYLKDKSHPF